MSVVYLGHSAFLFEDESGGRLLIDPFGNSDTQKWFLKPFPSLEVDLVAVTHDHTDHNAVEALQGDPTVMSEAGRRFVGSTSTTGVSDFHFCEAGESGVENVIYIIEHEGVRYCHTGHNRPNLSEEVQTQIGSIDVLMVNVGDSSLHQTVDSLVDILAPRVVIPMHYYIDGLTDPGCSLIRPDTWFRSQSPRRPLRRSRFRIDRRGLPYEREVWMVPPSLAG